MNECKPRQGLTIVNTGEGKGKTTASLGVILRSWGRGYRVCMIQFLKGENATPGEFSAARKLGIEWYQTGDGFTWLSRDGNEMIARARRGWEMAQEKIVSGEYDLIVLDEFTYPLYFRWLETREVIDWLRDNRPAQLHLIITGRYAPQELIEYADLVTEMKLVKHPFEKGVSAQAGIEF
jgi:cob(I)alamin adenosyltransferase